MRFAESDVRASGRSSQGVKAMKLLDDAHLVDMVVVREGSEMLTVTDNGFGKRVKVEDYRRQARRGMGVSAGKLNEKTGMVVALKQINPTDDILLITDAGVAIRINAQTIRLLSRTAMGVKMMRLKGTSKVASVAVMEPDDTQTPVDVEAVAKEIQEVEEKVEGVVVATPDTSNLEMDMEIPELNIEDDFDEDENAETYDE